MFVNKYLRYGSPQFISVVVLLIFSISFASRLQPVNRFMKQSKDGEL